PCVYISAASLRGFARRGWVIAARRWVHDVVHGTRRFTWRSHCTRSPLIGRMQMKVLRAGRLWLVAGAAAMPAALGAQAFGLNEIGSCAIARGFATTASPCRDASTIYWNPAAATWLDGWSVSGGVASIALNGRFTRRARSRRPDSNRLWTHR